MFKGESQPSFTLARDSLIRESRYFERTLKDLPPSSPPPTLNLFHVRLADFTYFRYWLDGRRIILYQHSDYEQVVGNVGIMLVNAFILGRILESSSYQDAAMKELLHFGRTMSAPDALADPIFQVTSGDPHSIARKLIVTIVANRMYDQMRPTRLLDGRLRMRLSSIQSVRFWQMYDWWTFKQGGRPGYPNSVEEFVAVT